MQYEVDYLQYVLMFTVVVLTWGDICAMATGVRQ